MTGLSSAAAFDGQPVRERELHTGIVVAGAAKRFGDRIALPPTDLVAVPGKVTLLTGRNGAGKTTLLRILATLVTADAGHIRVHGLDPNKDGRLVRELIGLALVNERSIYWRLTVRENVELAARIRGVGKAERRRETEQLIEEIGLADQLDQTVNELSAGQRQRTVLARALVGHSPVLLVDEPLRGLDDVSEAQVLGLLAGRAKAGATVLVASPTVRDFTTLADDIVSIADTGADRDASPAEVGGEA